MIKERTLLQPYRLGTLTLRNRVFLPAHTTNFAANNVPTSRNADYLAARAQGGVGLIITEAIRVHPSSAGRHLSLGSFDDQSIPAYASLTNAVHDAQAKIFAQIMHLGRQANGDATRTAAWAPSPVPWSRGAIVPHAMGRRDIRTLIAAFGTAARRMRSANFDGIEVHAGHGHLIQQFLSPATNKRDDEFGGSLRNRMRLCREVLDRVFATAGDLPVGLRISVDEFLPGGMDPDDIVEFLSAITSEFDLAYLHASHSAYHGSFSLSTQMADMHFPHAAFVDHAARVKKAFPSVPVLAVCRMDTLEQAADVIDAGWADMVGLARPHIADPDLVRKASGGRDPVTHCIACNQACIGRVEGNLPISCVVNPKVGEERAWERVAALPRQSRPRTLVVGGGPAGMRAAIAAHDTGADVALWEAGDRLGGQVPAAASIGGRARLRVATDDLERDVRRRGIDVGLRTFATAESVRRGGFGHVIVATGSRPSKRHWSSGLQVLDVLEAIEAVHAGRLPPRGRVVIADTEGTWAAASLAEEIARSGLRTELVSPCSALFARITTYTKLNLLDRLSRLPVGIHLMHDISSAEDDELGIKNVITGDERHFDGVGLLVDIAPPVANDDVYRELEDSALAIDVVGDANSPRSLLEAIYEGHRAGATVGRDRAAADAILTAASG